MRRLVALNESHTMTIDATGERHYAQIECNEAAGAPVFWLMAAVLPLLGFAVIWIAGVPFRFDVPAREFNPLALIPVVALLAGLFFLLAAIFMTLRLRKYSKSTLTLDKRPRIGGRVLGRVTSTVDVAPQGEWDLVLQCIETIKSAGQQNRVYRTDLTRWERKSTLPASAHPLRAGVPVDIAIPENCLEISDPLERARQKRGTLRWVLQLKGQRAGLNYLASFAIPIRQEREPMA
jgi:hypothetical protein